MDTNTETRFWSKVNKDGPVVRADLGQCWLWTAGRTGRGYAAFMADGRQRPAHVVAYELLIGPRPLGRGHDGVHLDMDHLCRVRHCVNPRHLDPVTTGENVLRGEGITAVNARLTHCHEGHELPPPRASGKRHCLECKKLRRLERIARGKRW